MQSSDLVASYGQLSIIEQAITTSCKHQEPQHPLKLPCPAPWEVAVHITQLKSVVNIISTPRLGHLGRELAVNQY